MYGLPDQPAINLEVIILPKPERTREVIAVGTRLKATLAEASGGRVAVRAAALDPQTYVALK
ncbi:hypothetical protein JZX87_28430 [Agrobacterium sp. Ap1]|uniref:hypothetical protein n=1 Tax=Rhizobium/Agrobacterium group TaxID=227290 RepID=UPI00182F527C|nr:hypothetical protein [Agrobacterium sp. Ap1]MBO0145066.1 hypothetical protein [Agrobacterium sp. Ap1]